LPENSLVYPAWYSSLLVPRESRESSCLDINILLLAAYVKTACLCDPEQYENP
jgi:hypothetical protein